MIVGHHRHRRGGVELFREEVSAADGSSFHGARTGAADLASIKDLLEAFVGDKKRFDQPVR